MGAEIPKQYLKLCGKPLFLYALEAFLKVDQIAQIFLILSPQDCHFEKFQNLPIFKNSKIKILKCGGKTRAESVFNALNETQNFVAENDFVLVHDAARALISPEWIVKLIAEIENDSVGGLLALPVQDTLKKAAKSKPARVLETHPREAFWLAQTPQMFRFALLKKALSQNLQGTDEAAAVENLGLSPRLVLGDFSNFKITTPADLALAELILKGRKDEI